MIHTSKKICGLDECGRGPLAGPLIACGVIITGNPDKIINQAPAPIRDSKKLTKLQRQKLAKYFKNFETSKPRNLQTYISNISVQQINQNGIAWANRQAFIEIINQLQADHYIVDGNLKFTELKSQNIQVESYVKADSNFIQVQIASIIAKVFRDQLMEQLHQQYPHYYWNTNAGYGTKQHIQALKKHGSTPHHRTQFITTALKK